MSCLPLTAADPGTAPAAAGDPASVALHRVVAGELREMRDMLEALAAVLVGDAHFARAYLEQLQSFDYLVQHADECARLLERVADGEDSLTAIGRVRLGAVQERLRAALKEL